MMGWLKVGVKVVPTVDWMAALTVTLWVGEMVATGAGQRDLSLVAQRG